MADRHADVQKAIPAVTLQPAFDHELARHVTPSERARLAVSANPRRIVIRRDSDRPGPSRFKRRHPAFWRRPLPCAPRGWDCRRATRLQRQEAMRASSAGGQRMPNARARYRMNITSGLLRALRQSFGRQARLTCAAGLMVPEDREQQNDRQRYAQQPQQCASSKAHGSLLH